MTFAELKNKIIDLSVEERFELTALITHLNQAEDPEYQRKLEARMTAMDTGEKFTATDLNRIHTELSDKEK